MRKSTAPLNNLAPCRLAGTGAPRSRTTFNFHEESITHPPSLSCVLMRLRKFQADRILHLCARCWQEKGLYLSSHASETHQNMTFDYYSELSLEMLQNPHLSAGVHLGVARLEPLIHMGFLTSPFFTLLRALTERCCCKVCQNKCRPSRKTRIPAHMKL